MNYFTLVTHKFYNIFINAFYRKYLFGDGEIDIDSHAHLIFEKDSRLCINGGKLRLDSRQGRKKIGRTTLRIDKGASVELRGDFQFMYDSDVILFPSSKLILGDNSFINCDCKIRCHNLIEIGKNCAISHDFTIMDSNVHDLNGDRESKPIHIGNNVWIGSRVMILRGVSVGDGAVIAAGSVVTENVGEKCLVGGVPARVIKEDIFWER